MKNYLIDTHAHIDMLEAPLDETLDKMEKYGVKKVINPAVEIGTFDKILELSKQYNNIFAMLGIYPSEAKTYTEEVEHKILENRDNIVAIGEVGLDYYWDTSFKDIQKEVFAKQVKLANRLSLPLVIHDRDAHKDTFDILKEHNQTSPVLFHCFSGSVEFMRECTNAGWYIALGGVVTFKNAVKMKEVAKCTPIEKLVLETDSPYLTPVPFRGKPNTPAYVKYIAEEIAKIRNMSLEELIDITTDNAERFFGI